jgi:hypothetical protein
MTEQWRAVPNFETYYEVSDHGNVRSLPRYVPYGRHKGATYVGRDLKQFVTNDYLSVKLARGGVTKTTYVHALVLQAFVGERPITEDRGEIRHLDGNRTNNTLSNLVYGTVVENGEDRVKHNKMKATYELS